jgi:hypothetical protein
LAEWNIEPRKVLLIITDNGSNMIRAVNVLNEALATEQKEQHDGEDCGDLASSESEDDEDNQTRGAHGEQHDSEQQTDSGESDRDTESTLAMDCVEANAVDDISLNMECETDGDPYEGEYVSIEFQESFRYKRLPCVVHTLQLALKVIERCESFANVTAEARMLVKAVRCSSVVTQQLIKRAGKSLISDCPTRWSSSYFMLNRLAELQAHLRIVCAENGLDCLSNSQWKKIENVVDLLLPFKDHTNTLQSDCSSLSAVIRAILDLQAHLKQSPKKALARVLLQSVADRFNFYLDPEDADFDATPAVACLLSPDVAHFLLTKPLLFNCAKDNAVKLLVPGIEVWCLILH